MAVFDIEPGQNPEAAGTIKFYVQSAGPDSGVTFHSDGAVEWKSQEIVIAPGGTAFTINDGQAFNRFEIDSTGQFKWGPGTTAPDTFMFRASVDQLMVDSAFKVTGFTEMEAAQTAGNFTVFGGDFRLGTAQTTIQMAQGANANSGIATLVGGTVTVNTDQVTADSQIHLTHQTSSGTRGSPGITAKVAGVSFTITSTSGTDTSQVAWFIIDPV